MRCRDLRAYWLLLAGVLGCRAYDSALLDRPAPMQLPAAGTGQGTAGLSSPPDFEVDPPRLPAVPPETRCGDGIISGVEKCDTAIAADEAGACPRECPPLGPCTQRALNGTACQAECVLLEPSCRHGDECCPGSCNPQNDDDCSTACGDGVIETAQGETCEPGLKPCAASSEDCADTDPCTADRLIGGPQNCNSECLHAPITEPAPNDRCCPPGANASVDSDCQPVCGNKVVEPGEACDGEDDCNETCQWLSTPEQRSCVASLAATACQRCICMRCTNEYLGCRASADEGANRLCSAVMACTEREECEGTACYCGSPPLCGVPRGPCQSEIEMAAGTTDARAITAFRADLTNPLGRASAADDCKLQQCRDVCQSTSMSAR